METVRKAPKEIHAKENGALSARAAHVWPDGSVACILSERRWRQSGHSFFGNKGLVYEHRASTIVPAAVDRVYELFAYFHHYPEFMRHVKTVSYYDDQNTHWVVDLAGRHEWDAINEGWQRNARIGWRATGGLNHFGEVLFQSLGSDATCVFVRLKYEPPGGIAGRFAAALGATRAVEYALQQDLDRFAEVIGESRMEGAALDWNAIRRRRLHTIRGTIDKGKVVPLRPTT